VLNESACVTSDNTAPELPLRRSRRNAAAPVSGDSKSSAADEFAAAAAALNFTSTQPATRRSIAAQQREVRKHEHKRGSLSTPFRKFAAATASVAAAGAIAAIVVGVVLPFATPATAEAEAASPTTDPTEIVAEQQLQGYVAGSSAESEPLAQVQGYEASTYRNLAAVSGVSTAGAFFENDITADIQYPFAMGTPARGHRLHAGARRSDPGDRRRRRHGGDGGRRRVRRQHPYPARHRW
jgi:hypothetical protein